LTRPAVFSDRDASAVIRGNNGKAAEQELLVELTGIGNPEDWMIDAAIPQQAF